jgi:two-component system LytT family response regulator
VLDGFCPEPHPEEQIALNRNGLMLFLRLADIEWLEAADNRVALHVGRETYVLRETLAALVAKLPPGRFRRIAPCTLVNVAQIKELQPLRHRRCAVVLRSGTRLTFMRS